MNYNREQKLLELYDKIYFEQKHKENLENKLDNMQFRYKCDIAKKTNAKYDFGGKLPVAIVLTVIEIPYVVFIIWSFIEMAKGRAKENVIIGVGFIPAWLVCFCVGFLCVYLWRRIILHFTEITMLRDEEAYLPLQMERLRQEIQELENTIAELKNQVKEIEEIK